MSRDEQNTPLRRESPQRGAPGPDAESKRRTLTGLADRFGVPALDVQQLSFPLSNLDLIPLEIARQHQVLPVQVREDAIMLAMGDPSETRVIEEVEFVSGRRVFAYATDPKSLREAIERAYEARFRGEAHYQGDEANGPSVPPVPSVAPYHNEDSLIEIEPDLDPELEDPDPFAAAPPTAQSTQSRQSTSYTRGRGSAPTLDSVFGPMSDVRGSTVLVVDDEEDIRRLLRRVLEDKGYRVQEADRGTTALAMVRERAPDAIVLDAMLPELHGFEICRRIKSSVRYGHIPILMISAVYRGWRIAEDLKNAYGVNAYLEKPFRIAELMAAVEAMLAGAAPGEARDPEALTAEADATLAEGMELYRRGDVDAAIARLEHAVRLDPLAYRLHYHLALLVGRKGDIFRAIQELETAIDLNPRSFSALKNLAVLYQQTGFKHKSIEMWERAIGHSPDDSTREQLKGHLMSLL